MVSQLFAFILRNASNFRFVTFTGNPNWPEITEALACRHKYLSRADIVCRIFMDKATEFLKDLTERHILGKVAGWCYSVEHQKRGKMSIFDNLVRTNSNHPNN